MLFLNPWLMLGLVAVAIPILIHLFNRQWAKDMDWGAMQFLLESIVTRRRRIQLEEILLMAVRCLFFASLALGMARAFLASGSLVSWVLVLPLLLGGLLALAARSVLQDATARVRRTLLVAGIALLALAGASTLFEMFAGRRAAGDRDVAIVIDCSPSMTAKSDDRTNFERALAEARQLVAQSPRSVSFCLVAADASATPLFPAPVSDRRSLLAGLDRMRVGGGVMNVPAALIAAADCLARGSHATKQIILLSDDQAVDWRQSGEDAWRNVAAAFRNLPGSPSVVWRRLSVPVTLRNVAITGIALPETVAGVDRDIPIEVTLRNSGRELITPGAVELREGERLLGAVTPVSLEAGASVTVKLTPRFATTGLHALSVRLTVQDDIEADNEAAFVVPVAGSLDVLLSDGSPAPRLLDREAGFATLALAPGYAKAAAATIETAAGGEEPVHPVLLDAQRLAGVGDFSPYHAVMLANVPRLTPEVAANLGRYVESGGGLLIALGDRSEKEFYNGWTVSGRALLPARLLKPVALDEENAARPALDSFSRGILKPLADPRQSDLDTWTLKSYWSLGESAGGPDDTVLARLATGEPLLVARRFGRGRVLLSAFGLGANGGNLPTRQGFVPMMHLISQYLAAAARPEMNLPPGPHLTVNLFRAMGMRQGLRASYFFAGDDCKAAEFPRIDPNLDLDWGETAKEHGRKYGGYFHHTRWTGSLLVPQTTTYTLELESSHSGRIWLDGDMTTFSSLSRTTIVRKLEAGRRHDLELILTYNGSGSFIHLSWSAPGIPRQIVPPEAFVTARGEVGLAQVKAAASATGPDGAERTVAMDRTEEAVALHVSGNPVQGLYRLKPSPAIQLYISELADQNGSLLFTVQPDRDEADMTSVSDTALGAARRQVQILDAQSLEDAERSLQGKRFGREIWKLLMKIALALLVAETVLTRWIAVGRKAGEWKRAEFDETKVSGPR